MEIASKHHGMAAPLTQTMSCDLCDHNAVVVRQYLQMGDIVAQTLAVPYEQANRYKVSPAPAGVTAAATPDQADRWQPSAEELAALPQLMHAIEESNACYRTSMYLLGCLNLRAFQMHFYPQDARVPLELERPFRCGGWCGCPLRLVVHHGGATLGRVEEDWDPYCGRCCNALCACTYYDRVLEAPGDGGPNTHVFTIRTPLACCGRVNNCCGATCCKDSLVIDILDSQGKEVGHIQKMYGGKGAGACCRMMWQLNNYVLDMPAGASERQRALLLGALMHVNYAYFEKSGGQQ